MSGLNNESFRMPDRERYRDHRTFLQKFGKQILMSIAASLIAGCILNATGILKAVRWFSSVVIHTTGDPLGDKPPIHLPHIPDIPKLPIPVGMPSNSPLHKSPEQLRIEEELRKAKEVEKAEAKRRKLEAQAERLKIPYDKEWTLEKLESVVEDAEQELREEKAQAEEEEKKKPLLVRADAIGLIVDKTLPYKELKQQVEKGEKKFAANGRNQARLRQYEENLKVRKLLIERGPNARCPNPKCHYQWRTDRKNGQFICPKCRGLFNITQAKASMPPPPMPMYPKLEDTSIQGDPNFLDRLKGVFGK